MPLVTVQFFAPSEPEKIPKMISEIRDLGALTFQCSADNIWVIFQPLQKDFYVQRSSGSFPLAVIKAQKGRSLLARKALFQGVAGAVGKAFSVPTKEVWIQYQEMNPEDLWYQTE